MTRLSKTFQLALSLAMMVGATVLTSAQAVAQDRSHGESSAGRGPRAEQGPALVIECGWMPAAPQLPLEDGAEYAEVTERDPSESEGDEDHTTCGEAAPAAPVLELLRGVAYNVPRSEKQLCSSQAAVSTGAPRGPPLSGR